MKRAVGYVAVIAGLVVLTVIFAGFKVWIDRSYNAWAYAKPPLTQTWTGDADAGPARLRMTMTLERDKFSFFDYGDGDTQDNHRSLSGQAMLCDSTGRRQSYSVAGTVKDRHAERTLLIFSPPQDEVPGLRPTRMLLSWDGRAGLAGDAELAHALPGGGTRISSSDPETGRPIRFEFKPTADGGCSVP
jgi:hypothetical protein